MLVFCVMPSKITPKSKLCLASLGTFLLLGSALFAIQGVISSSYHYQVLAGASDGASYYSEASRYYEGIDNSLVGEELITALSSLTSTGFVNKSYSSLPNIYQYSDVSLKDSSKMQLEYTGSLYSFSNGSIPSNCNKEHTWPASWYGTGNREQGAGSPGADAHNVWPCDTSLNSKRGSCAYDEINQDNSWKCSENGSYSYADSSNPNSYVYSTAHNNSNGQATDQLYPAEGYRGMVARCLMYVATRYHNNTTYPVMIHDQNITLKSGRIGKLSTLLKWHFEEPPTEWEIRRNQEVATRWHHCRNPFIDNPQYAEQIYRYLPEPDSNKPTDAVINALNTYATNTPVSGISLNSSSSTIGVNGKTTLVPTIFPSNASNKKVTWLSTNSSIASVDNGVVAGLKSGKCSITATTEDGGYSATCEITVDGNLVIVTGVTLLPNNPTMEKDQTLQLTTNITPSNATNKNVSYESSDNTIVEVSNNGLLKAIRKGQATISVTSEDGGFSASTLVTVNQTVASDPSLILDSEETTTDYAFGQEFSSYGISGIYVDSYGNETIVSNGFECSGYDCKKLGSQKINVQYKDASSSYLVNVSNDGAIKDKELPSSESIPSDNAVIPSKYYDGELLLNGNKYEVKQCGAFAIGTFQIASGSGNGFYNKEALPAIKSIVVTKTEYTGIPAISSGSEANPKNVITPAISGSKYTFDLNGATFFSLYTSNSKAVKISSIVINYVEGGSVSYFTYEEQADAYVSFFLSTTSKECEQQNVLKETWDVLKAEYLYCESETKNLLKINSDNETLDFRARYQVIINKYHYEDFVYGVVPSANLFGVFSNDGTTLFIVLGFAILLTASISTIMIVHHKKRTNK